MTSVPGSGRGGEAGPALSRLKSKGRLNKAASRSVVSDMFTAREAEQPHASQAPQNLEAHAESNTEPQTLSSYQQSATFQQEPRVPSPAPAQRPENIKQPAQDQSVPEPNPAPAKPKSRRKMSLAPTEDEHDQIRQTFMATRHIHRYASLNDFLRACVLQEVARLEEEYNNGQPFQWQEAEIPKGRPLRF